MRATVDGGWAVVAGPDEFDEAAEPRRVLAAACDRDEFALLYRRHVGAVYRFCHRRLGNKEDAEDATAQVFARALAGLPGFRGGSFRAWLFRIAERATIDRQREPRPTQPLDGLERLADPGATPEDAALAADAGRQLARLLGRLTPDQCRVVELRLAGLSGREIAQVMGKTRNAVDALHFRAAARLRELGRQAVGEDNPGREA